MTAPSNLVIWSPRALAIALALFLGLFAMDALQGAGGLGEKLVDLFKHLTPTWLCLLAVAVAWKREWLGTVIFTSLALFYAWWAWDHPQWILAISGPLLLVAALYLLAWRMRNKAQA